MTTRDPDAVIWQVLDALGLRTAEPVALGAGLASEAWRIGSAKPWFALRIARSSDSSYEVEHAVMHRLAGAGANVPRPVRGSWQVDGWTGPSLSLATGLDGEPLAEDHRLRAAPALAAFLRLSHAQAVEGYGALEIVGGRLRGRHASMHAGLMDWSPRPLWPLGGATLDDHPALTDGGALRSRLDAHAQNVRVALDRGPGVLLHSDLHEENILEAGEAVGIIDFGQALVGPAAWEFAALSYFTDWSTADATLQAYARDGSELLQLQADATAIGLCFGVHRWAQDRESGIDEDAYDEGFLRHTLSRM